MHYKMIISVFVLTSVTSYSFAGSITDSYAVGDTLTAEKLTTIKSAINDNDTVIDAHTNDEDAHHSRYTNAEAIDAINNTTLSFVTPLESFYPIYPSDFVGSGNAANHEIGRDWQNGVFKLAGETNAAYASVRPKHNSTINSFQCILDDQSVGGDPTVTLYRQAWAGGAQEIIASVTTDGGDAFVSQEFIGAVDSTFSAVDLDAYFYYAYASFGSVDGSSVMVRRCKVGYSYSEL